VNPSNRIPARPSLKIQDLERRILMSATCIDTAMLDPSSDPAISDSGVLNQSLDATFQHIETLLVDDATIALAIEDIHAPPSLSEDCAMDMHGTDEFGFEVSPLVASSQDDEHSLRHELILVGDGLADTDMILAGIKHDPSTQYDVYLVDRSHSGWEQLNDYLAERNIQFDAVHFVTHGTATGFRFGSDWVNADTLSAQSMQLAQIANYLSDDADLILYGCSLAETEYGRGIVDQLAVFTSTDVAASIDATGHTSLGANWNLEYHRGDIETSIVFSDSFQSEWNHEMLTYTVRDDFTTAAYTNNNGTNSWTAGWSETDAGGSGATTGNILITGGQLQMSATNSADLISRQANLSGAHSATLTFTYDNTLDNNSLSSSITLDVSTDGITWTNLDTFSKTLNTVAGSKNYNLTSYISSQTRVRLDVGTAAAGSFYLYVDNFQISYDINTSPTAVSDTATAVEAGGVSNGTAGTNPTGNVLTNDTDADSGDTKTVTGVAAGVVGSASGNVSSNVVGTFGTIHIGSNGVYTYTVDNSNTTVQALRTSSNTLTDTFTYTMRDTLGLTSTTQITVTIQGANDAPNDITGSLSIAENSANGTSVGTVTASDVDSGDTRTYSLTGDAGGRFAINSSTGQVTVANSSLLDYESVASHSITVRATDTAGATFDKAFTVTIADVAEALTLTAGNDTFTDNGVTELSIDGSGGNDLIYASSGNDNLNGGSGTDTVSYENATTAVTVNLSTTTAQNTVGSGSDQLQGFENLTGSAFNDTLTGDSGDNVIRGAAGNDSLTGGAGNDTFTVDLGTDTITDLGNGADIVNVSSGATANATAAGAWTATASTSNAGTATITAVGFSINVSAATGISGWTLTNSGNATAVTLTGSANADILTGGTNDDTLVGGAGNDSLTGGAGNDTFTVGSGTDTITDLGNGVDIVNISAGATANATAAGAWTATASTSNAGTATITAAGFSINVSAATGASGWTINNTGNVTAVTLTGSASSDYLYGGVGVDTIVGGAGDDYLQGNNNNDTLTGGAGIDSFYINSATDTITDLGDGVDIVMVITGATANATAAGAWTATASTNNAGTATVTANGFNINLGSATGASGWTLTNSGNATGVTLTGSANADVLTGGSGNDTLVGGAGNDSLTGGTGNDTFTVASGTDTITDLGNGVDILNVSAGATANATAAGAWTATASSSNAGTASITASGFSINVSAVTGASGWTLTNSGNATVVTLTGSANADILTGGTSDDTLVGGAGNDSLTGGAGNDTFTVGSGTDTITDLGNGVDIVNISAGATANATAAGAWTATASTSNAGTASITASGFSINVSAATGASGWTLTNSGNATAVTLTGSANNDTLTGGTNADTLVGGAGDDIFSGGAGNDIIDGGDGNDTIVYSGAYSDYSVTSILNGFTIVDMRGSSPEGTDTVTNVEFITFSGGNFRIVLGTDNTDTLTGSISNECFFAFAQDDTIDASDGDDVINAGDGDDTLNGQNGNDFLLGGNGNDTLTGGAGNDTFNVTAGTDSITDLGNGTDILVISAGATANATAAGAWTATASTSNAGTATITASGFSINVGSATGASGWTLTNSGNATAVTLTGSANADVLTGGTGNDTLVSPVVQATIRSRSHRGPILSPTWATGSISSMSPQVQPPMQPP
jgi:VCBS repeat-containing protein